MNREIKFRVYDNEGNIFADNEPIGKMWQEEEFKNYFLSPIPYKKYGKRWEVMQFTGLKDKNGKEIYEGDILSFDNENIGFDEPTYIVNYRDGYFVCGNDIKKDRNLFLHSYRFKHTSILGNIYQNPDLLKL